MKIILLKDVKKQGKKGDILEVKDGYATFLINSKSAVAATTFSIDKLQKEKQLMELEEQNLIKKCEEEKKKIENLKLVFKVKTGAEDKVFGSISPKQIIEELKNKGYSIDKKQVNILSPITSLGIHVVNIVLHKKVIAKLKIELKK